jgi:hypothetical protein
MWHLALDWVNMHIKLTYYSRSSLKSSFESFDGVGEDRKVLTISYGKKTSKSKLPYIRQH